MTPPINTDDSNFKRAEDQKWRERTEERIVGLTSSESVQNDRLDEIDEELIKVHEILDGKSDDRDDNGIKGDLKDLSRSYNELRALMAPDHLGHGGIINRLKALERNAGLEEKKIDNRWKLIIAVAVGVLGLLSSLIMSWDKVSTFLNKKSSDPLEQMIERAKNPRGRHLRKTVIKVVPEEIEE